MLLCLEFWASILSSVDVQCGGGVDFECPTAAISRDDRCVPQMGSQGGNDQSHFGGDLLHFLILIIYAVICFTFGRGLGGSQGVSLPPIARRKI